MAAGGSKHPPAQRQHGPPKSYVLRARPLPTCSNRVPGDHDTATPQVGEPGNIILMEKVFLEHQ